MSARNSFNFQPNPAAQIIDVLILQPSDKLDALSRIVSPRQPDGAIKPKEQRINWSIASNKAEHEGLRPLPAAVKCGEEEIFSTFAKAVLVDSDLSLIMRGNLLAEGCLAAGPDPDKTFLLARSIVQMPEVPEVIKTRIFHEIGKSTKAVLNKAPAKELSRSAANELSTKLATLKARPNLLKSNFIANALPCLPAPSSAPTPIRTAIERLQEFIENTRPNEQISNTCYSFKAILAEKPDLSIAGGQLLIAAVRHGLNALTVELGEHILLETDLPKDRKLSFIKQAIDQAPSETSRNWLGQKLGKTIERLYEMDIAENGSGRSPNTEPPLSPPSP